MLGLSSVGSVGCLWISGHVYLQGGDHGLVVGGKGDQMSGWTEGGRVSLTGKTGIRDTWMEGV